MISPPVARHTLARQTFAREAFAREAFARQTSAMTTPRILALAGSTRSGSFNKKLVRVAAAGARRAGADVQVIDLRDFALPLFDQDLEAEQGQPAKALELKELMAASDGFLIASPEYNSSITAVLKNAIDWVSRRSSEEPPLIAFRGKAAALMSASPGALGGLRGLVHLRAILGNLGVLLLPDQRAVSKAHAAFDDDGSLKDPGEQQQIEGLGEKLASLLDKLASD